MGRRFLESHFAVAGSYIFTLSVLLAGLLLSTDYFMFRAAAVTTSVTGRSLLHVGHAARKRTPREVRPRRPSTSSLDEETKRTRKRKNDEEDRKRTNPRTKQQRKSPEDRRSPPSKRNRRRRRADAEANGEAASAAGQPAAGAASKLASGLKAALGMGKPPHKPNLPVPVTKPKTEREDVIEQLDAAEQQPSKKPTTNCRRSICCCRTKRSAYEEHEKEVRRKAKILEKTFTDFGFNVKVVEIETGPVIAQFEVELEAGLRLSKITGLADDLAIALRVPSVRIVAPIPGKNTVGIEVPNDERQLVRLREVIEETQRQSREDADSDLPGQRRRRQPDGRRPGRRCRTC